jgi:chemotaxis protein methyltransferase CheR
MRSLSDSTYRGITNLMHATVGLSFNDGKKALVSSRLAPRIQRLGLGGFDDYLSLIDGQNDNGEFQMAVDLLTTNETYFFREPSHFDLLEREFGTRTRQPVAVWSAASSFGDEAYSVAMVLADLQLQGRIGEVWSVLGTDISDRVLRSAQEAIYPEERLRHVPPQRLKRYCLRGEGEAEGLVQIRPHITDHVRFGQMNLSVPIDPPGPFDVVFLRNVLIYFDAETKRQVVNRVLEHLKPSGLFFIGTAEGRVACDVPLATMGPGAFRKLES